MESFTEDQFWVERRLVLKKWINDWEGEERERSQSMKLASEES